MTLDLDNMTQAEFDKQMAEIKERSPNLFQFIADFVDRKVSTEEVEEFWRWSELIKWTISRITKRGHDMNELDLTNTQAVVFMMVLIGLLLYLNHRDRKKAPNLSEKTNRR